MVPTTPSLLVMPNTMIHRCAFMYYRAPPAPLWLMSSDQASCLLCLTQQAPPARLQLMQLWQIRPIVMALRLHLLPSTLHGQTELLHKVKPTDLLRAIIGTLCSLPYHRVGICHLAPYIRTKYSAPGSLRNSILLTKNQGGTFLMAVRGSVNRRCFNSSIVGRASDS